MPWPKIEAPCLDIPNQYAKCGDGGRSYEIVPTRALDLGRQCRHQRGVELHPRNASECERKYKDQAPHPDVKREEFRSGEREEHQRANECNSPKL